MSDADLDAFLRQPGEPIFARSSPESKLRIAESLRAEGHVVARFAGRSEFGARALGNRSILADPSRTSVVKIINRMIKSRDFWMPFAASMAAGDAPACVRNPKGVSSPYMILAFDTTERVNEFAAAVHPQDLTVRPQIVERAWNPGFHDLLCAFHERTAAAILVLLAFMIVMNAAAIVLRRRFERRW